MELYMSGKNRNNLGTLRLGIWWEQPLHPSQYLSRESPLSVGGYIIDINIKSRPKWQTDKIIYWSVDCGLRLCVLCSYSPSQPLISLSVWLVTSQQHHLQRLNLKELKVWSSLFDTDERTEEDAINQTIVQEEENDPHICRDSNSTQPCCLYRDEGGDWRLHGEARWFILLSTEQNYVVLHLYLMTTGYIVDYQNCQLLWGTRRKLQHIIKLRESTEPRGH